MPESLSTHKSSVNKSSASPTPSLLYLEALPIIPSRSQSLTVSAVYAAFSATFLVVPFSPLARKVFSILYNSAWIIQDSRGDRGGNSEMVLNVGSDLDVISSGILLWSRELSSLTFSINPLRFSGGHGGIHCQLHCEGGFGVRTVGILCSLGPAYNRHLLLTMENISTSPSWQVEILQILFPAMGFGRNLPSYSCFIVFRKTG